MAHPKPESDVKRLKARISRRLLHDLRSPLTQIIGYSEMLVEDAEEKQNSLSVEDLQRIRAAGHRLLSLIENNFIIDAGAPATDDKVDDEPLWPGPSNVTQSHTSAPGRLLVVDDDETNRDVLSRRLKLQGHDVETASNGREALRLVRESSFDLVLLDIMMPDMDGYEVLGHIKSDLHVSHLPVIMISALDQVQSVVRCIEAGAEDYLTKPFNPTLLKARIGACLEKKRGRDRETALFEQLQENYGRLQEVEKLRDDMRNMIVHDLRTPLTAVIMGVEMLKKHGELNEIQHEMITVAASGGSTLLGMINDLLDVEKMESDTTQLEYEKLSPETLVMNAVEQVTPLAESGQTTLVTNLDPGLPTFEGDKNMLSRTLVNLVANAIKFTPAGTVTISASPGENDRVLFAVRDTGQGIPSQDFERIFEKFGQLDSTNRIGTGLGLAFCKLAVEAHGGEIHVESALGKGSTFYFTIPLVAVR